MEKNRANVFLLHAAAVSMGPINECFAVHWPEAKVTNILEDGLYDELKRAGRLTQDLIDRICMLGQDCERAGADAIMLTGSAFGPAVDQLKTLVSVPVLKPNEAFYEAICSVTGRIVLLSTVPAALSSMVLEIEEMARERQLNLSLEPFVIHHAFDALQSGDMGRHDHLVTEAIRNHERTHDVIAVGQFSMWPVAERLKALTSKPILTTPDTAVRLIRRRIASHNPNVFVCEERATSGVRNAKSCPENKFEDGVD